MIKCERTSAPVMTACLYLPDCNKRLAIMTERTPEMQALDTTIGWFAEPNDAAMLFAVMKRETRLRRSSHIQLASSNSIFPLVVERIKTVSESESFISVLERASRIDA